MKVAGVIAEYNPFHNGHKYQLEQIRQKTKADYIIVAMSGDFLQRGVPALTDKYTRARMALSAGADLVLELPAVWAASSAEYFAAATDAKRWIRTCFMRLSLYFLKIFLEPLLQQVPENFRNISLLF